MLSCLMAGPIPLFGEWRCLRHQGGLQRMASAQILSFGVSSHPLMWHITNAGSAYTNLVALAGISL